MEDLVNAEIRPKRTWRLILNVVVIGIWCAYAAAAIRGYHNREAIHRTSNQTAVIFAFVAAGFLWVVFTTLKTMFYVETISVTSSTLSIAGTLFGIQLRNKSYDNATVRGLRYAEWSGGRSGMQNAIRFEVNDQTVTFARQADEAKSYELIDKMCEAYKFAVPKPKTPAGVVSW
jgi:hypothetical protein